MSDQSTDPVRRDQRPLIPRLSTTLPHAQHPRRCQACNAVNEVWILERWQEHDDNDLPEPVIVVLCQTCSKWLIEPHPRLYRQLQRNEPFPGVLDLCVGCRHRDGTRCTSPDLKVNGGEGVAILIKKPDTFHVRASKSYRSGWRKMWTESATLCQQREAIETTV